MKNQYKLMFVSYNECKIDLMSQ